MSLIAQQPFTDTQTLYLAPHTIGLAMRTFKFGFVLFAFVNGSAIASCLPDPSASDECRYLQGDAWCAEQEPGHPYAYSDQCLAKHSANKKSAMIPQQFHGQWEQSKAICANGGSEDYFAIDKTTLSNSAHQCDLKKVLTANANAFTGLFHCNMEGSEEYNEQYQLEIKNGNLIVDGERKYFLCKEQ